MREVIVRIISEEQTEPTPVPQEDNSAPSPTAKRKKNKEDDSDFGKVFAAYVGKRAWSNIKSSAQYFTGKYFTASENYRLQTNVDNAMDTIDFGVSTAFSMVAASKLFKDTAVGSAGGAVIGLVVTALNKTIQTVRRFENETQKIMDNAYGNYFYGERAGYVAGGHGTEN